MAVRLLYPDDRGASGQEGWRGVAYRRKQKANARDDCGRLCLANTALRNGVTNTALRILRYEYGVTNTALPIRRYEYCVDEIRR